MSRSKKRKIDQQDECPQPRNRFQESGPFSDLTLVVEGHKLHVHKTLLMMHSPVFQRMLAGHFREKDSTEIPLPGKKYAVMVGLLEQIYPGHVTSLLTDEILADLLQLADEYDIQQVFTNTMQYIGSQLRSEYDTQPGNATRKNKEMPKLYREHIMCYLALVERYPQLSALRERLVKQVSLISPRPMAQSKYFLSLPATATRDVILLQAKKTQ